MRNHITILLLLTPLYGACASWAEVPKALDPVLENTLPVTGETLLRLSDAFYALCGRDETARTETCQDAQRAINAAIRAYNRVNDPILDSE